MKGRREKEKERKHTRTRPALTSDGLREGLVQMESDLGNEVRYVLVPCAADVHWPHKAQGRGAMGSLGL